MQSVFTRSMTLYPWPLFDSWLTTTFVHVMSWPIPKRSYEKLPAVPGAFNWTYKACCISCACLVKLNGNAIRIFELITGIYVAYGYCTASWSLLDNVPTNQLVVSQVADWATRWLVYLPTAKCFKSRKDYLSYICTLNLNLNLTLTLWTIESVQ